MRINMKSPAAKRKASKDRALSYLQKLLTEHQPLFTNNDLQKISDLYITLEKTN